MEKQTPVATGTGTGVESNTAEAVLNPATPVSGNSAVDRKEIHRLDAQIHAVQRLVAGVCEHFAALRALVALAITALPKFPAFRTAVVTSQSGECA